MRYAPDKNDPYDKGGNNGGNGGGKPFRVTQPVEIRSLAGDMADEFGGSLRGWRRHIRQPSRPVFDFGGGGHRGDGKDGDGGKPDPGRPDPGRPDTESPMHRAAFAVAPMAFDPPVVQQRQSQPLSPEMINLIRNYMMRG